MSEIERIESFYLPDVLLPCYLNRGILCAMVDAWCEI